jgi:hypothetical protein
MSNGFCTDCGQELKAVVRFCPNCGAKTENSQPSEPKTLDEPNAFKEKPKAIKSESNGTDAKRLQKVGYIASAISGASTFLPIVTLPILGSVSFFGNGRSDGVLVLVLSGLAAFALYLGKYTWLLGLALGALVLTGNAFIQIFDLINDRNFTNLGIGWLGMLGGSLALIWVAREGRKGRVIKRVEFKFFRRPFLLVSYLALLGSLTALTFPFYTTSLRAAVTNPSFFEYLFSWGVLGGPYAFLYLISPLFSLILFAYARLGWSCVVSALPMLMYPVVEDAFWSLRQRILIYERVPALEFSVLLPILGFLLTLSACIILWRRSGAKVKPEGKTSTE